MRGRGEGAAGPLALRPQRRPLGHEDPQLRKEFGPTTQIPHETKQNDTLPHLDEPVPI